VARPGRSLDAALFLFAVVVLCLVGLTLHRDAAPAPTAAAVAGAGAAGIPPAATPPAATQPVPSQPVPSQPVPSSTGPVQDPTRLLVVGDDFAAGDGASTPAQGFAELLGRQLGGPYVVDGQAGTGFTAGGRSSFPARVARLVTSGPAPDLVVVEGGHEDHAASAQELRAAVRTTVERLDRAWPDAQVVLLGTTRAYPENRVLAPLHATLRKAAAAAGVPFVDPVAEDWLTAQNSAQYVSGDLFHPSDAGHAYFAERLLQDLRDLRAVPG